MKKKKLVISDDLKRDLQKMREILADVKIDNDYQNQIRGTGCWGFCNVTCSYYCEDTCADSCMGEGQIGCAYKEVCPGAPLPPDPDPTPDN